MTHTVIRSNPIKKYAAAMAAGLLALVVVGTAQAQVSAEDAVKFRQSGYTFMQWNMGRIHAMAIEGSVPYNEAQVQAAANVIAAIANSGMGALYSPETLGVSGWKMTRLQPNFFDELPKVGEIATNFSQQATRLQEVAAEGDRAAVAAQLREVTQACRSCHQNFRGD